MFRIDFVDDTRVSDSKDIFFKKEEVRQISGVDPRYHDVVWPARCQGSFNDYAICLSVRLKGNRIYTLPRSI